MIVLNSLQEQHTAEDCVATSLLDTMVKRAKDPDYMESVVRGALGSMYSGTRTDAQLVSVR